MAYPNKTQVSTTNNQLQDIVDLLLQLINGGSCCTAEIALLTDIKEVLQNTGVVITDPTGVVIKHKIEKTRIARFAGASMAASIALFDTWAAGNMDQGFKTINIFPDTAITLCVVHTIP